MIFFIYIFYDGFHLLFLDFCCCRFFCDIEYMHIFIYYFSHFISNWKLRPKGQVLSHITSFRALVGFCCRGILSLDPSSPIHGIFLTASLIKKSLSWIFSVQAKEIKIDSYRLKEKERRKKNIKTENFF